MTGAASARATVLLVKDGRRARVEAGSAAEAHFRDHGFADEAAPDYAAMSWFALRAAARRLGFEGRTKAEALAFLRRRGLLHPKN